MTRLPPCIIIILQFSTIPTDSTVEIRRIFRNKTFRPSGVCRPRSRRSSEWNHRALYIGSHNNKVYVIVKYVRLTCAGMFSDILMTTQGLKSNTIRYIRYDTRCYFIVRSQDGIPPYAIFRAHDKVSSAQSTDRSTAVPRWLLLALYSEVPERRGPLPQWVTLHRDFMTTSCSTVLWLTTIPSCKTLECLNQNRERKCGENYNKWHNSFFSLKLQSSFL